MEHKLSVLLFMVMFAGLMALVFADFKHFQDRNIETNHIINIGNETSTTIEKCYIRSHCQGHVLDHQKSVNKSSCLSRCKSSSKCQWITFDYIYHFCTQYSTCPSLGHKSCDTCITSARDCQPKSKNETCNINGRCQVCIFDCFPI